MQGRSYGERKYNSSKFSLRPRVFLFSLAIGACSLFKQSAENEQRDSIFLYDLWRATDIEMVSTLIEVELLVATQR